jgi:hypothetical protein
MHMVLFDMQTVKPGPHSAAMHRILISVVLVGGCPQRLLVAHSGAEHLCLNMQGRLLVLEQRGDDAHAAAGWHHRLWNVRPSFA